MRTATPVAERLREASEGRSPEECWPWPGPRNEGGYGRMGVRDKVLKVHRVSFELANGRPPIGMVRHSCDNPPCFNPAHLLEGTAKQNTADARERGRMALGEALPQAVLTEDDVREIRRLAIAGETYVAIGERFGIWRTTARQIATGEKWKHLSGPVAGPRNKKKDKT
jgi:hypothetical protein